MAGKLYLIPNTLGNKIIEYTLPPLIKDIVHQIDCFLVENHNSAISFLQKIKHPKKMEEIEFFLLNKETKPKEIQNYLKNTIPQRNLGILSEAGLPCIADPGAIAVAYAHQLGISVVPLSGPSAIFLALMASGFNGQQFCFHGYLPIDFQKKRQKIQELEKKVEKYGETQIFIEAPHRNQKLFENLLVFLKEETYLCVACDLTLETENIQTKTIQQWKNQKEKIVIQKKPTVFLIGKPQSL